MNNSNVTIETKNLLLKSIAIDYAEDIFREFTSEITVFMSPQPAKKIEETIEFIETSIRGNVAGNNLQVVILRKENGEFLGNAGLHHVDRKNPELGIWIKKSAHGNAFGKEAMTALKEWADQNLDYEYILYPVVVENIASRRIPESFGGKVFREYDDVSADGRKMHLVEYRIYNPKTKF